MQGNYQSEDYKEKMMAELTRKFYFSYCIQCKLKSKEVWKFLLSSLFISDSICSVYFTENQFLFQPQCAKVTITSHQAKSKIYKQKKILDYFSHERGISEVFISQFFFQDNLSCTKTKFISGMKGCHF